MCMRGCVTCVFWMYVIYEPMIYFLEWDRSGSIYVYPTERTRKKGFLLNWGVEIMDLLKRVYKLLTSGKHGTGWSPSLVVQVLRTFITLSHHLTHLPTSVPIVCHLAAFTYYSSIIPILCMYKCFINTIIIHRIWTVFLSPSRRDCDLLND